MNNLGKDLPKNPGVYIFRDKSKKVLYVGKAISLNSRVSSYFQNPDLLTPKTGVLVSKINNVDYIKVENEIEALLLEADLIKRYHPPYNINLKDDKYYKYIKIEKHKGKVYKITTARKITDEKAEYFGPYPETTSIYILLKTLRKVFPYSDCSLQKFARYKKANRPCLYGHIGVCPAPCISEKAVELNNSNVKKIEDYLNGDRKSFFNKLQNEMNAASKDMNYEKAAILRDQIISYEYLTQSKREVKEYMSTPNLLDDARENALDKLIEVLSSSGIEIPNASDKKNFRLETYDISNIQGKNAVGSMVVLTGGTPDKNEYRRFKIKFKKTPDDFFMLQEVLRRRFAKKVDSKWQNPNLILIDGGKGQLSSALEILGELEIRIPCISLAKREEEIIIRDGKEFKVILLKEGDPAVEILKLSRDEAHRFAIGYYRKLHKGKLYA